MQARRALAPWKPGLSVNAGRQAAYAWCRCRAAGVPSSYLRWRRRAPGALYAHLVRFASRLSTCTLGPRLRPGGGGWRWAVDSATRTSSSTAGCPNERHLAGDEPCRQSALLGELGCPGGPGQGPLDWLPPVCGGVVLHGGLGPWQSGAAQPGRFGAVRLTGLLDCKPAWHAPAHSARRI